MVHNTGRSESSDAEPKSVSVWRPVVAASLAVGGVLLAGGVIWVLGPGAAWWLEHVDGVRIGGTGGLAGKELAEALDVVRGRVITLATGVLAAVAIYYTANNAVSARRTAEAALRTAGSAEQGLVTGRYTAAIEQLAQLCGLPALTLLGLLPRR